MPLLSSFAIGSADAGFSLSSRSLPGLRRTVSDRELAADLFDGHAAGQEFLAFGGFADDLFGCVTSTRRRGAFRAYPR